MINQIQVPYELNVLIQLSPCFSDMIVYCCFCFVLKSFLLTLHWPQTQKAAEAVSQVLGLQVYLCLAFFISLLFIYLVVLGTESGQVFYGWPHSVEVSLYQLLFHIHCETFLFSLCWICFWGPLLICFSIFQYTNQ